MGGIKVVLGIALASAAVVALWGFGVRGEWYAWASLGVFCYLLTERPS